MPQKVLFSKIPRMDSMNSEWRKGMRAVEDAFAEHVENMHKMFDEKSRAYEEIQSKIEANHRFMDQHYIQM